MPIIYIKNEDLESKPPFPVIPESYRKIEDSPFGISPKPRFYQRAVLVKPDGTEIPFTISKENVDHPNWQSLIDDIEQNGFLNGSNFNHQTIESYITDLEDDGRINGSNLDNDLDSGAICFLGHVLVETDQGKIQIKDITSKNTIDGNEIVGVVKVKNEDNHMILFKKDSLGVNIPSEDTYVSRYHSILIKDEYIMAERLINNKNIIKEVRGHDYNL